MFQRTVWVEPPVNCSPPFGNETVTRGAPPFGAPGPPGFAHTSFRASPAGSSHVVLVRSTNSRPPARIVPLRGKLGPLNVPGASLWKRKRPAFTRAAVGLHRYAYWFPVEGRTVRLWIFRSGGCVEAG